MSDQNLQKIINIAIESNLIDGLVVDGTLKADKGLVVGEKNKEYAINQLKRIKQLSEGKLSLISTGGVLTGRDVYERVKAGASLVTIYSAFLKEVRRS
jgi:dihydroorotate dehydrogenase